MRECVQEAEGVEVMDAIEDEDIKKGKMNRSGNKETEM